jgi:hypothetical protein
LLLTLLGAENHNGAGQREQRAFATSLGVDPDGSIAPAAECPSPWAVFAPRMPLYTVGPSALP